ncbi:kinase-like protein, partial [Polychaeton citri CBS 116435]
MSERWDSAPFRRLSSFTRSLFGELGTRSSVLPNSFIEEQLAHLCAVPSNKPNGSYSRIPHAKLVHAASFLRALDQSQEREGRLRWSLRPRIYVVLRAIGAETLMDCFADRDVNDIMLPFDERTLPGFVRGNSRQLFLEYQRYVLDDAPRRLEATKDHTHFSGSADDHFGHVSSLGAGGFGFVDVVWSKLSLEFYARKRVIRAKDSESSRESQRRFEEEIRILKDLSHPHLIKVLGSYTDTAHIAFLMQPIADMNLYIYLQSIPRGAMDVGHANSALKQFFGCLAGALDFLHDSGIRHRDLKPQNILIKDDRALIGDFGAALDCGLAGKNTTQDRNVQFTPQYAAPEVGNRQPRSYSSDMWSLGLVFLDMLTVMRGSRLKDWHAFLHRKAKAAHNEQYAYQNVTAVHEWIKE